MVNECKNTVRSHSFITVPKYTRDRATEAGLNKALFFNPVPWQTETFTHNTQYPCVYAVDLSAELMLCTSEHHL